MKKIIYSAGIGILFVNLLFPLIYFFGLNKTTFLIILYSFPLLGVLVAIFIENERLKTEIDKKNLIEKNVIIRTNQSGIFQGIIKNIDDKTITLGTAKRLDLPDAPIAYRIFIDRNEIKSMEVL
jgi:hypothetical protein